VVNDSQLKDFSNTQKVYKISDTIIQKNNGSITSLLNYHSPIYFKENGAGMVSSPAFRGTTAQQTAVIWNGIAINSQLNGQTDFNTLNVTDFNSLEIRAGGGSVIYGSGAVGGSIHLNNLAYFNTKSRHQIRMLFGSFETYGGNYNWTFGNDRIATNVQISANTSTNNYRYLDTSLRNENGAFQNLSWNNSLIFKINDNNILKYHTHGFDGERYLSGTISVVGKSKYDDFNTRNLLEWIRQGAQTISKLKTAYLTEHYTYFENKNSPIYNYGKANTFIGRYDYLWRYTKKSSINGLIEYNQTQGSGSNINPETRNIGSASVLWKQYLHNHWLLETSFRKEWSSEYDSPFLFALGTKYNIAKQYSLCGQISKNYRIPTFNDLYWQGSGNPDLQPEYALQGEIGQDFKFKSHTISTTLYHINLDNLLRWIPNRQGIWQPENVAKVTTKGAEFQWNYKQEFNHHHIDMTFLYAYTQSTDAQTQADLIYVPRHKATFTAIYHYKKWTVYAQHLFHGEVYTSSDNYYALDPYTLQNLLIERKLNIGIPSQINFQINNILNNNYQNVIARPMPGRHYQINLILNL
jgi:iron complex outermembrane receptor protein